MKRMLLAMALLLLGLTASACFDIHVRECRTFPAAKFDAARERIEQIERAGRDRPRELRLLVYDGEDHELVELGIPFWMVKRFDGDDHLEWDHPGGDCLKRHAGRSGLRLNELKKRGPGLVAQIDDEENDAHVLVWLE